MVEQDKTIKEYSKIEAAISVLTDQYAKVADVSTEKGLVACKKDYREIRKYEIDLDKKRKDLGAAARDHLKLINSEAATIDGKLKKISAPHKEASENREKEIEEQETARVKGIRERIDGLQTFIAEAHETDSAGVSGIIEAVDLIDCTEGFDEFTAEALRERGGVIKKLGEVLQGKVQAESAERERLAAEESQRKAEEAQAKAEKDREIDQRINNLNMMPMSFIGKSVADITEKLNSLAVYVIPEEEFGDRYQDAQAARDTVMSHLVTMKDQAQLVEDAEAERGERVEATDIVEPEVEINEVLESCAESAIAEETGSESKFTILPNEETEATSLQDEIAGWANRFGVSDEAVKSLMVIVDAAVTA